MSIHNSWSRFLGGWLKDVRLAIFIVGLLTVFRFALTAIYFNEGGALATINDFIKGFGRGFLFDVRVGLSFAVGTFVLGLFVGWFRSGENILNKLRAIVGCLGVIATSLLGVINIGFFGEYHDQFNHWVLGLVHDDQTAIFASIWKQYPVIWVILGTAVFIYFALKLWLQWVAKPVRITAPGSMLNRFVVVFIMTSLMAIGLRGSVQSRPLQRDDLAVTQSEFVNKIVNNPYFALYYTYSDHKHVHNASGLRMFRPDEDISSALKNLYPGKKVSDAADIDSWLEETATAGLLKNKPKHIFLIVLESQDSWPFLEEYEHLQLVPNLKQLAQNGIHVKRFVSAGTTTRTSLNAMISGLGDASVYTHLQKNSLQEYPTAMGKIMKSLGYKTRLFYGGHLSWQRLGDFAKSQGFEETYGQEHMSESVRVRDWGVLDEDLFDFILETVDSRKDVPSFNIIMTTTNHSPYPADLASLGCPLETDKDLNEKVNRESATPCKILGHQWYNDYCVGKFVGKGQKALGARVLWVITGDHTSRRFYKGKVSLYEEKSVPLILYGPGILDGLTLPISVAGGHLDIIPTLVDLIGSSGQKFNSIGTSLWRKSDGRNYGFGADIVIGQETIGWVGQGAQGEGLYNDLHAVSWWRIMNGNKF